MNQAETAHDADQFFVESSLLRAFVDEANAIRRGTADPRRVIEKIRPRFAELLGDKTWLPARFQEIADTSGMGRGIGTWLLYRAGDAGLAFSSLVVAPGVQTPVHDHLAWGLVGLYAGEQEEDVFTRRDDGAREGQATLTLAERRFLRPGDLYELLPDNDIHRVRTASAVTSVSLHLLGNDNGCIWRHQFVPEEARVEPFRSGYVNFTCPDAG
ncbi:MAG: hypothetical protein ACRDIY_23020 [Chloroflexota bacterium]